MRPYKEDSGNGTETVVLPSRTSDEQTGSRLFLTFNRKHPRPQGTQCLRFGKVEF